MKNFDIALESAVFDSIIKKYHFPVVFKPWPENRPLSHGESLQRMIDATDDEIIVLCDVDAFPLQYNWDSFILNELSHKEIIAVINFVKIRKELPFYLHPSFMVFRRSWLKSNKLDVLSDTENDPAYKLTQYFLNHNRFNSKFITPLIPTHAEVPIYHFPMHELINGHDIYYGFGTTYNDLIYHFWFSRHLAIRKDIYDDEGKHILNISDMEIIINKIKTKHMKDSND